MKKRLIAWLRGKAVDWVGEPLARRGITANQVTVAGALIFAAGFVVWMFHLRYHPLYWLGIGLAAFGGTGDWFDGAVAKAPSGYKTEFGKVLDSWTDRVVETAIWGALGWVTAKQHQYGLMFGCFTALGGSILVSYSRQLGEAAVKNDREFAKALENTGYGDRMVRLIVIGVGVIAGNWFGFAPVVVVINLLAWETAVHRLLFIRQRLAMPTSQSFGTPEKYWEGWPGSARR